MTHVGSKVYTLFFLGLSRLEYTPDMLFRGVFVSHCQN